MAIQDYWNQDNLGAWPWDYDEGGSPVGEAPPPPVPTTAPPTTPGASTPPTSTNPPRPGTPDAPRIDPRFQGKEPGPGEQWVQNPTTGLWEIGRTPSGERTSQRVTPWTSSSEEFTAGSFLPEGWAWPSYAQPNYLDPGPFDPGPAFTYKDFAAPNAQTMLNEPGFQFRMDQGRKALESSAAGRGVLRSGGTLKDIMNYGQNFASQEFGNVFNRAAQEYDMNRRNAFDTWQTGYGGRKDAYGFRADNFGRNNQFNQRNSEFDFSGRQRQAELEFQDAYNRWVQSGNWAMGGGV